MNYLDIKKSKFYNETYKEIEELKKNFPVNHGFKHVNHVIEYAKSLANLYNLNNQQRKLLYIACALHDVGYIKGREEHAASGSEIAREFLANSDLKLQEIDVVCNAIASHGGKKREDFLDPVSRCLAIADKMDFTRRRYDLKNMAYDHVFKTILETDLRIEDDCYNFDIIASPDFKKDEFNDDYFGAKLNRFLGLLSGTFGMTYKINFIIKK